MALEKIVFLLVFLCGGGLVPTSSSSSSSAPEDGEQLPLVMVGILARNTAHTLPNFLGYLENLDYPKDRMTIWIRTDHNVDNTASILSEWAEKTRPLYLSVDLEHDEEWVYESRDPLYVSDETYTRVSQLRQKGLEEARKVGAHYIMWLDCDVFLSNNQTLQRLMEQQKPVIAPMLQSENKQAYSNFWCGQNEQGYYKRTPEYIPIITRAKVGHFKVPVVYGAFLIDLTVPQSRGVAFWPLTEGFKGPVDDVVHFAYSARTEGLEMYILNTEMFGFIIKAQTFHSLDHASRQFLNFKLQTMVNYPPVLRSQYITHTPKDTAGLDKIFMISLERRPERRNRMLSCLEELRLNFTLFDAVDGRRLNQSYLDELGITYMPGWKDPWGERPMTFGEVGCFLSHYFIWEKVVSEGLEEVLVLEDDVDFQPDFRHNLKTVLDEARKHSPSWDLIYVGRKILNWDMEKLVGGTKTLAIPHYSYWTLGYLVSIRGAKKLLEARPFQSLLPVDEYLPIMFNTHPETDWAAHFPTRNLEAYSAHPLLVNPTHYVGDEGWFSDTEPPIDVLEKIRDRKLQQEKEEEEKAKQEKANQDSIKEQARKRQIEAMKMKLKPKTEL